MTKPLGSETVIMQNIRKIMTGPEFMSKIRWQVLVIVLGILVAVPGITSFFHRKESDGYKDAQLKALVEQVGRLQAEVAELKKHQSTSWTINDMKKVQRFLEREQTSLDLVDRNAWRAFVLDLMLEKR